MQWLKTKTIIDDEDKKTLIQSWFDDALKVQEK